MRSELQDSRKSGAPLSANDMIYQVEDLIEAGRRTEAIVALGQAKEHISAAQYKRLDKGLSTGSIRKSKRPANWVPPSQEKPPKPAPVRIISSSAPEKPEAEAIPMAPPPPPSPPEREDPILPPMDHPVEPPQEEGVAEPPVPSPRPPLEIRDLSIPPPKAEAAQPPAPETVEPQPKPPAPWKPEVLGGTSAKPQDKAVSPASEEEQRLVREKILWFIGIFLYAGLSLLAAGGIVGKGLFFFLSLMGTGFVLGHYFLKISPIPGLQDGTLPLRDMAGRVWHFFFEIQPRSMGISLYNALFHFDAAKPLAESRQELSALHQLSFLVLTFCWVVLSLSLLRLFLNNLFFLVFLVIAAGIVLALIWLEGKGDSGEISGEEQDDPKQTTQEERHE